MLETVDETVDDDSHGADEVGDVFVHQVVQRMVGAVAAVQVVQQQMGEPQRSLNRCACGCCAGSPAAG
jgi:hypothetical protein